MSSPYTRLMTEDEDLMYDAGRMDMRDDIIKLLKANLDDDVETDALHYQNLGIQIAITLIEGENK